MSIMVSVVLSFFPSQAHLLLIASTCTPLYSSHRLILLVYECSVFSCLFRLFPSCLPHKMKEHNTLDLCQPFLSENASVGDPSAFGRMRELGEKSHFQAASGSFSVTWIEGN